MLSDIHQTGRCSVAEESGVDLALHRCAHVTSASYSAWSEEHSSASASRTCGSHERACVRASIFGEVRAGRGGGGRRLGGRYLLDAWCGEQPLREDIGPERADRISFVHLVSPHTRRAHAQLGRLVGTLQQRGLQPSA